MQDCLSRNAEGTNQTGRAAYLSPTLNFIGYLAKLKRMNIRKYSGNIMVVRPLPFYYYYLFNSTP